MAFNYLQEFIKQARGNGMSDAEIKGILGRQGWPEEEIEKALRERAGTPPSSQSQSPPPTPVPQKQSVEKEEVQATEDPASISETETPSPKTIGSSLGTSSVPEPPSLTPSKPPTSEGKADSRQSAPEAPVRQEIKEQSSTPQPSPETPESQKAPAPEPEKRPEIGIPPVPGEEKTNPPTPSSGGGWPKPPVKKASTETSPEKPPEQSAVKMPPGMPRQLRPEARIVSKEKSSGGWFWKFVVGVLVVWIVGGAAMAFAAPGAVEKAVSGGLEKAGVPRKISGPVGKVISFPENVTAKFLSGSFSVEELFSKAFVANRIGSEADLKALGSFNGQFGEGDFSEEELEEFLKQLEDGSW